ncbi:hypothetical protein GE09DRAFT_952824 [Coniochaeta sp. 2T2.1]|nr:hypothetical protein GE09DRAFT_952824 [Coniochaeta sp. 2T2.1]
MSRENDDSRNTRPRLDTSPQRYSEQIQKQYATHTRAGQACDRCKTRKIKCDGNEDGCAHCANLNISCMVTDRITGNTQRRGYAKLLEREIGIMQKRIQDMEALLQSAGGIEVLPFRRSEYGQSPPPGCVPVDATGNVLQDPLTKDLWTRVESLWIKNYGSDSRRSSTSPSTYQRLAPSLDSRPTEEHLGVLGDSAPWSSIKGTTLSAFGTTIDIAFDGPDLEEPDQGTMPGTRSPLYNKSVMAMLQTTMGVNPKLDDIDLPTRDDAFNYSEWYFLTVHPFIPVLHRPSFDALLARKYDDPDFKPTTCELVLIHMVFATIYYQFGMRNQENLAQFNDLSNKHYHWSLGKLFDMASEQSVIAVQALAMIAIHTRSFPKPGCSAVVTNYALSRAIEMNLHRGQKILGGATNIENEVRKRVWYTVLGLSVALNGRLGRPMPISVAEFDVDLPLAIPDECITDDGITDASQIGQCSFLAGLTGFRLMPLWMEMYSNMYSVRRNPAKYTHLVRSLEQEMREIRLSLPADLDPGQCAPDKRMFALWTEGMFLEFQLCLRHPSVCTTRDPAFMAENTRICEQTARKLLDVALQLLGLKCLDTAWYQLSVYVAAILSILVAHWERRFQYTPAEVDALRADVTNWMRIVYVTGEILGSTPKLGDDIRNIAARTIGMIEHDMRGKLPNMQDEQHGGLHQHTPQLQQNVAVPARDQVPGMSASESIGLNNIPYRGNTTHGNEFYNAAIAGHAGGGYAAQAAYPSETNSGGQGPSLGSYDAADGSQYNIYGAAQAGNAAQGINHSDASTNPLIAFASQATAQVSAAQSGNGADADWRQSQANLASAAAAQAQVQVQAQGTNPWPDWSAAMSNEQTEQYSANALLNLGAGRPPNGGGHGGGADMGGGLVGSQGSDGGQPQWPMIIYGINSAVGGPPDMHNGH